MSDRRTIIWVLAILTALLGVAVTLLAAFSLQDPFTISGELGTRTSISGELIAATVIGLLLVAGGIGTPIGLVRAQQRDVRK